MADTDYVDYPTGQFQIGAGDLQHATSIKVSTKNNGKSVGTLRRGNSGFVMGVPTCDGSFETVVPADGTEFDYFNLVASGKPQQLRVKIPAKRVVIEMRMTAVDLDVPLGDTVKCNVTWVGKIIPT